MKRIYGKGNTSLRDKHSELVAKVFIFCKITRRRHGFIFGSHQSPCPKIPPRFLQSGTTEDHKVENLNEDTDSKISQFRPKDRDYNHYTTELDYQCMSSVLVICVLHVGWYFLTIKLFQLNIPLVSTEDCLLVKFHIWV